jgi:hypothetical protein
VFLATSLLLSVGFAARVPLDGNPDEHAHLDYIRLLVEERGFVRFIPREQLPPGAPSRDETHQSPLYYLLCVPVYALAGGSVFVLRLVARCCSSRPSLSRSGRCATCSRSGPSSPRAPRPSSRFCRPRRSSPGRSTTTVSPRSSPWRCSGGSGGSSGAATALDVRRETLFLGALLGLGLLTKLSVLQLLPAVLLACLIAARAGAVPIKGALTGFAIVTALGLLIASPWLARNTLLYGDPLTLGIYRATGPNFTPRQVMDASGWDVAEYARNVGVRSFATFWYFLPPDLPFTRFTGSPVPLLLVSCWPWPGRGARTAGGARAKEARRNVASSACSRRAWSCWCRFSPASCSPSSRHRGATSCPCCSRSPWSPASASPPSRPRRPAAGALGVAALLLAFTLYALTGGRFGG